MLTIADLGEHEVLRRLHPFCGAVVGDDAAVQPLPMGEQLVVSTDVLVDGVHFCDRTLPPKFLGWRAAAVNLSDLAAMGSRPMGLTIGLTLPPETPWSWLEAVYQGITHCLEHHGGVIMGGDLCRGPHRSLAITALGSVPPHQALYRNRATAGQSLVVTGCHGASRAGLAILLDEIEAIGEQGAKWITAHQQPVPRFDAIATLRAVIQSIHSRQHPIMTMASIAVMDSSDGLADAVVQICTQSNVGAQLRRSQLPMPSGLVTAVGQDTAEKWTLYGGEDFELIMSLPPAIASAFIQRQPGSQLIGITTPEPDIYLCDDLDQGPDIKLECTQGYQHFG